MIITKREEHIKNEIMVKNRNKNLTRPCVNISLANTLGTIFILFYTDTIPQLSKIFLTYTAKHRYSRFPKTRALW